MKRMYDFGNDSNCLNRLSKGFHIYSMLFGIRFCYHQPINLSYIGELSTKFANFANIKLIRTAL